MKQRPSAFKCIRLIIFSTILGLGLVVGGGSVAQAGGWEEEPQRQQNQGSSSILEYMRRGASLLPFSGDDSDDETSEPAQAEQPIAPAENPFRQPDARADISPQYVALGDSIAAGLGLPQPSSATNSDQQCGRSTQAYSSIVAREFRLPYDSAACSGATSRNLYLRQRVVGPNISPQISTAFGTASPDIITITAGANDIRWDSYLRKCYGTECGAATDTFITDQLQTAAWASLNYAMYEINRRSFEDPPTVVLTGYYDALSEQCVQAVPELTASEYRWLSGQVQQLNRTIQDVARQYDNVYYAPVDFTGHDICSADPWVQGINDPAPFHPTAAGHQAIADSVLGIFGM